MCAKHIHSVQDPPHLCLLKCDKWSQAFPFYFGLLLMIKQWMVGRPSLVPRPCPKNRERGLVVFPLIFCCPLPLKILRSQSDCRMKPRGTWSHHMRTRPKVPSMQYGRVACDGVVCLLARLREIGEWLKLESAVYPYGLFETNSPIVCWHWLGSQSTEMIFQNLCIDSVHPNWIDKHER